MVCGDLFFCHRDPRKDELKGEKERKKKDLFRIKKLEGTSEFMQHMCCNKVWSFSLCQDVTAHLSFFIASYDRLPSFISLSKLAHVSRHHQ